MTKTLTHNNQQLPKPVGVGGSAGDPIPLPMMLTGHHEDMELTMNPDVTADDDGDGIARQQQPAEGGRAEYLQEYNNRRRENRAAQRVFTMLIIFTTL